GLEEAGGNGDVQGVLGSGGAGAGQAILVMEPGRAARWQAVLAAVGCAAEVWHVGGDAGDADDREASPLADVIRDVGVSTVGLYIDAQHLRAPLGRLSVGPDLERAVSALQRRAGMMGDVLDARVYGRWSSDEAVALAGRLDGAAGDPYGSPVQIRFVTQEGAPPEKDPLVADLRELLESPI